MRSIGLVAGLSWESTLEYYRLINRGVNELSGESHSAPLWIYSFDFQEVVDHNRRGDFAGIGKLLEDAAIKLQTMGAEAILLCANSAHRWADRIEVSLQVPLLHIADATGVALKKRNLAKPLLLGTSYTMEGEYIRKKLEDEYGAAVHIPDESDRKALHNIIFDELVKGRFSGRSRRRVVDIINKRTPDVDSVILGCTELPLLIRRDDTNLPLLDTLRLHAETAVDFITQAK